MSGTLQVNPSGLRAAAAAQSDVAASVSALGPGQLMAMAGTGVSDLVSGGACHFVASALDKAAETVNAELLKHSERLIAAADRYAQDDEVLARRIRRIGG